MERRGLVMTLWAVLAVTGCGDDGGDMPDAGTDAALPLTFSVGGTVTNLAGTGLVLENNGGDALTITDGGAFTFPTRLESGAAFAVTIASQPANPQQTCTVSGGTGVIADADVTSVTVDCATDLFTIGGAVEGLVGAAVLELTVAGVTEQVTITADGTYAFPTAVPMGTAFAIAVATQPETASCHVVGPSGSPGSGTVGTVDVTDADVRCVGTPELAAIAPACDTSTSAITWTEIPGATYTLEYGVAGNLSAVQLAEGETSYTPTLGPGDYVARVQAHVGALDGPVTAEVPFHVGATPVVTASNDGPACLGGAVTLTAQPADGTAYEWTGPNGVVGNTQTALLTAVGTGGDPEGTYTVTVTRDGCTASASTIVATSSIAGAFQQTTTAQFDANTGVAVTTADDEVKLAPDLDLGAGASAFHATADMTLAGGTYEYSSFTIAAGVTVTVTGPEPLVVRSTGPVTIAGFLDARGKNGTSGVTFSHAGTGGAGGPGGAPGGDGAYGGSGPALAGTTGAGPGGGGRGLEWSGGGGGGHAVAGVTANTVDGRGLGGVAYGSPLLPTAEAGSGGGGGGGGNYCGSGGGGGGGGYVRIEAPSISIPMGGAIRVDGGNGGSDGTGNCGGGGGGSGGSIHLRAPTLSVAGALSASGGTGGASTTSGPPHYGTGGSGAIGRIRYESENLTLTGSVTPAPQASGPLSLVATTGSTRTPTIAPVNQCSWGTLTFTTSELTGTELTVNVLGANDEVLVSNVSSGTTLAGAVAPGTPIKLEAVLDTTSTSTPVLSDWEITYTTR